MARQKTAKPTGAELRALRDQRATADPTQEAQRHEASFLANMSRAQSDFEWIAQHQAWLLLGFASLAEWWEGRVKPVLDALALRPGPEMAQRVIEMILAAEAELPAPQRRSKKELAALVGASEWKSRGREDHRQRRSAAGGDLGPSTDTNEPVGVPDPRPTDQDGSTTPPVDPSTQTAAEEGADIVLQADGVEGGLVPPEDTPAPAGGVPGPPPAGVTPETAAVERTTAVDSTLNGSESHVEGSALPVDPSTQNHPPAAAGEAPVVSAPSAGAGAQPSVPLGEAGMGDETAGGLLASGLPAVDLEDDEEPPIASPEELKNLIDEWLAVLDRRVEYGLLAPQYDEDSLLDLEFQIEGFARTVALLRRWWKEEQA